MELGEAIYREITGRSPHKEVSSFGQAIQYLVSRFGSASAAARASGFPSSSFRHWVSSGRVPSAQKRGDVVEAALLQQRRDRLPAGREARMRAPGAMDDLTLSGTLIVSDLEEEREIDLGRYMDEVQNDLIDAYLDGASTDELAEIFLGAVDDPFYRDSLEGDGPTHWEIDGLDGWR